jgi:hypothetical protein
MMSAVSREQVARLAGKRIPRLLPGLVAGLLVALAFAPALAQPHYVRLSGWVQWIAGEKLMLALNDGSGVVPVDLERVPLDQYRSLTQRDQVMVTGVVSEDNRGVFGASITHIPEWGMWEDQMP